MTNPVDTRPASSTRHHRTKLHIALSGLLLALGSPLVRAEEYPSRPSRIVVGFSAGGTTDIVARLIAQELAVRLGQPFMVDNRAGASGTIAAGVVAKSPRDGYTLLQVANTQATVRALMATLPYEDKDLAPVILLARSQYVLVVHPSLEVTNLAELRAYLAAHKGINYASSGTGTPQHLAGELFARTAALDISHVPYKGSGALLPDVLAGRVPMVFENVAFIHPQIRSGALRAIAVTGLGRSSQLPEVPTMAEAGLANFEVTGWYGLAVPSGTPTEVIGRLNKEANAILVQPAIKQRLNELGVEAIGGTPAQFKDFLQKEQTRWSRIITDAGIKLE